MACEPSLLPLSATRISPRTPWVARKRCAFPMQVASVSASFRHGMTIDSSGVWSVTVPGDSVLQGSKLGP